MALARLGNYSDALSTFRRAIALHQETDSLNRAGDVALTLVQELGEQLAIAGAITTSSRTLDEEVFLIEHELISKALENAQGRVRIKSKNSEFGILRSEGMSDDSISYATPPSAKP